jgi:RNA polymerase sigma factor (sigma-70 family)
MELTIELFTERFERVRPALVQEAQRRCGWDDAEDVVQEAWMRASRLVARRGLPADPAAFARWLLRVVGHVSLERLFRERRERERLGTPEEGDAVIKLAADSREPEACTAEARQRLQEAFARIGFTERQASCLRLWLDGLCEKQIARRLGIRQQVVNGHLAYARQKLQELRAVEDPIVHRDWFREASAVTIYRAPRSVWDRRGTAEEIQRRRVAGD